MPNTMNDVPADFHPFFLSAGGVQLRAARFDTPDARAVCVLLNGQTEFMEKYSEVIGELRGRGFAIVTFDWRGQGGSDRLLPDPRKAHIADFAAYDEDLDTVLTMIAKPMAAEKGVALIGLAHSMGGHNLVRRLHAVPGEFSAAFFCAPMMGINMRGAPAWLVERIAAQMNRKGPSTDYVWGMAGRDQITLPFTDQLVTSDPKRYARNQALLAADPDLRLDGPTWGWLGAALASIARSHEPGFAEAIQTPALLFGAGHDRICLTGAARDFAARMPQTRYIEIAGAEHEILMERDVFRDQFWLAFDGYLKEDAPAEIR